MISLSLYWGWGWLAECLFDASRLFGVVVCGVLLEGGWLDERRLSLSLSLSTTDKRVESAAQTRDVISISRSRCSLIKNHAKKYVLHFCAHKKVDRGDFQKSDRGQKWDS